MEKYNQKKQDIIIQLKWLIPFFVVSIIIMYFFLEYQGKTALNNSSETYQKDLTGRITYVGHGDHCLAIRVNKYTQQFFFITGKDPILNDNIMFDKLAQKGDSIYKPAYCDTIFIIKKDRIYKYHIGKGENKR